MNIETVLSDDGKKLTLTVSGKMDVTLYKEFNDAYKDKIDLVSKVVLDFKDVEYVDSSGLGMLLVLRERSGGDAADIDIINVNPDVKKILETTNFQHMFNIQ